MYQQYKESRTNSIANMDFEKSEKTMELPWEVFDEGNGFGLDCGGSVCKVVYLHRDDWKAPDDRQEALARVRCLSFPKTDIDAGLAYLKDRVHIRRKTADEIPLIWTTGIGGSQFAKQISEVFNIRSNNLQESQCFLKAFVYLLKNTRKGEHVDEHNPQLVKALMEKSEENLALMKQIFAAAKLGVSASDEDTDPEIPLAQPFDGERKFTDISDIFPCFFVMIGSNGAVFCVKEDGSYEIVTDLKRAGRTFMGLGNILTGGGKSYEELMSLAEQGNMLNVHEYVTDFTQNISKDEDNMYSVLADMKAEEMEPAVLFGKGLSKGEFEPRDLTKSLLCMIATDITQTISLPLKFYPQVKHVFLCGGFPSHPLTREFILTEMLVRDASLYAMTGKSSFHDTHFLTHGQHLGALGALLNHTLRFQPEKQQK